MTILPSDTTPFGFIQPLHEYIIAHAFGLTFTNSIWLFIIPLVPLSILNFLVLFPKTRPYRVPLGIIGVGMVLHAVMTYRFDDVLYNGFNNGIGVAAMHLSTKYIEFGFLEDHIVDPYVVNGTRSYLLAAIDLSINSRMIGLGRIEMTTAKKSTSNGKAKTNGDSANNVNGAADGGVKINGQTLPHHREAWLPYTNVNRSRPAAVWRHFTHALTHYAVLDVLVELLWHFGSETIGNPYGSPNAARIFLDTHQFILFPTSISIKIPQAVVEATMVVGLGIAVWQSLSSGYHSFALLAVGSGIYEVEAWEVDLFNEPWKADSLLDLWGRRWHQLFRHHFLLISTLVVRSLGLPVRSIYIVPLIFAFSGGMHAVGQISMSPLPNPSKIALLFILSGVGCALEAGFKRVTGRRVRGSWGRLWMWTVLLVTGRLAMSAWLDGGLGGTKLVPVAFPYRPGPVVVQWLNKWVIGFE